MRCYFSPAKLNLFFRVLYKREDGFHEIASLFQAVNFGDTIKVELADADEVSCNDPTLPCDNRNLVTQARDLFRVRTGLDSLRVRCRLEKRIPMEAGLGGGSSNAATMLHACNDLAGNPASLEQLACWGAELGSDVPFFFSSGSAYCTGRGEKMVDSLLSKNKEKPFLLLPGQSWIAKPHFGVSTPKVYQACRPETYNQQDPLAILADFRRGVPHFFNDLEDPAFMICPSLREAKEKLQKVGFSTVVMTGSGSAFLCMGLAEAPLLEDFIFIPVEAHERGEVRSKNEWYSFPSPIIIDNV